MNKIKKALLYPVHYLSHPWYPLLVAILAMADVFILVVPNDILFGTAILAKPTHWLRRALLIAMGSVAGALLLVLLLQIDLELVRNVFPEFFQSSAWTSTEDFLKKYGTAAMFLTSVGPIPFQPF